MSIDYLLLPLSEVSPSSSPCGISLLHEPEYDAIGAAREEDDPTLPRGVWTTELKRADWPEVVRLCEQALRERSKDLQIAAWLGEAWIASLGLNGGVRATRLLHGLCERFWACIHPLPRDGDMDYRTAPFDWIDEHWSRALAVRVALIAGRGPDGISVTLAQWQEAAALDNDNLKKKKGAGVETAAGLTRPRILAQLASMTAADLVARLNAIRLWRQAIEQLSEARLPKLAAALAQCDDVLRHSDLDLQQADAPSDADSAVPETDSAAPDAETETEAEAPASARIGGTAKLPAPQQPAGRDEAYQRLGQIADYLSKVEPHSPVPTLIRRAIAWGQLPFPDLLNELTHNNNEMQLLLLRKPLDGG